MITWNSAKTNDCQTPVLQTNLLAEFCRKFQGHNKKCIREENLFVNLANKFITGNKALRELGTISEGFLDAILE
jgi:hypothetical protein